MMGSGVLDIKTNIYLKLFMIKAAFGYNTLLVYENLIID